MNTKLVKLLQEDFISTSPSFRLAPLVKIEDGPFIFKKQKEQDVVVYPWLHNTPEEPYISISQNLGSQFSYIYSEFVRELMVQADKLKSEKFNLSTDHTDVLGYIEYYSMNIQKNTGVSPNVILMSPEVASRILAQDQIRSYRENTENINKTQYEALTDWFRTRLGLDLIIEQSVGMTEEGTCEFIAGNTIILAVANKNTEGRSCFVTPHKEDDFINFEVKDNTCICESTYAVKLIDPSLGLRLEVKM